MVWSIGEYVKIWKTKAHLEGLKVKHLPKNLRLKIENSKNN